MYWMLGVVMALALAARVTHGNRRWVTALVVTGAVAAAVLGRRPDVSATAAIGYVAGASALGFILPELWESLQGNLRLPQMTRWILVAAAIALVAYVPQVAGTIVAIAVMIFAIRMIITPFRGSGGSGRRRRP